MNKGNCLIAGGGHETCTTANWNMKKSLERNFDLSIEVLSATIHTAIDTYCRSVYRALSGAVPRVRWHETLGALFLLLSNAVAFPVPEDLIHGILVRLAGFGKRIHDRFCGIHNNL